MDKTVTYRLDSYFSKLILWNDETGEINYANRDGHIFYDLEQLKNHYGSTCLDGEYGCKEVTYTNMLVDVITTVVINGEKFTNIKQKMIETDKSGKFVDVDN